MAKLIIRNSLIGVALMAISSCAAAAIFAILSIGAPSFAVAAVYIFGGIIGLACAMLLERFFLRKYDFFERTDLESSEDSIWLSRIRDKKFVKRTAAYLTYLPLFLIDVGVLIAAIVLYPVLAAALLESPWYSLVCAVIGASLVSLAATIVLGITSFRVCKNCGAVNAFIYDETLENEASSDVESKTEEPGGNNLRVFFKQTFTSHGSGDKNATAQRSVESFSDTVARHCACCGCKSVITTESTVKGSWQRR